MIKFLVQLLCLFVPVRSWRKAIRGSLGHLMYRLGYDKFIESLLTKHSFSYFKDSHAGLGIIRAVNQKGNG